MTPQEHEDLVRGIILEQRLRKRIAQLQEYRRHGIRSLADAAEYEAQKRRRDQAASVRRQTATYLVDTRTAAGAALTAAVSNAGGAFAGAPSAAAGQAQGGAAASSAGAASASAASSSLPARAETVEALAAAASDDPARSRRAPSASASKRKRGDGEAMDVADAGAGAGAGAGASSSSSSSSSSTFSLEGMPGADRLSDKERALCEHLRLLPVQYQQVKATIVNISLVRGYVRRGDPAGKLVHIDAAKVGGVYDFVVSCGWATAKLGDE
jgi:transcriptional adapter 2-alpha